MIPERVPNASRTIPSLAYARGAGSREQGEEQGAGCVGHSCMVSTGRGNLAALLLATMHVLAPLTGGIA